MQNSNSKFRIVFIWKNSILGRWSRKPWEAISNTMKVPFLESSLIIRISKRTADLIHISPVRMLSLFLLPFFLLETLLIIINLDGIVGYKVLVNILFLCCLTSGAHCKVSWKDLKDNSYVIKLINNTCKTRE